jgi:hypothetical protein
MMNTFAGGTVPAAVISIGITRSNSARPSITAVAREIGLAGQNVHGLGARGARQQLEREGDHPRLGVGRDLLGMLIGIEHADQDLPRAQHGHLVESAFAGRERALHLEDHLPIAIERGRVGDELRSRIGEALVGISSPGARSRLHQNLDPATGEALDGVRRGGDARLVRTLLLGNANFHVPSRPSRLGLAAARPWVAEPNR